MATKRTVFFISDSTGITAESLGHSLLSQFEGMTFRQLRIPFVDSVEKARDCVAQIMAAREADGVRPVVVSTLVNPEVANALREADALVLEFFETFIAPLEAEFGIRSSHAIGKSRKVATSSDYAARIDAVNYALAHDDGVSTADLDQADIILVGVSRSGKTPTSLYLALQFSVRAANYPLIPEDFERNRLPDDLNRHREKVFGLSISPERLARVREARRPGSPYASLENCRYEVEAAQQLMRRHGIRWFDSTTKSIEEIAASIMQSAKLEKVAY
ncbi:MAG TPA: pyruvate, water dikinase regulatory protein [Gemmatimonadaceae bacterium]|jgi:regulator of PEP synthase PpsR (kinase-PPPase family)|nr:pyruvate, water dikinase regulatory protein [Gemmatimonadaceae bacterium]